MTNDKKYFSVKFKGKIYDDAFEDSAGHIRFNEASIEYIPNANPTRRHVYIHGFRRTSDGGYTHTCKESKAKVEILE